MGSMYRSQFKSIFKLLIAGAALLHFFIPTLAQSNEKNSSFRSPVEFPIVLSANFGELRTDHFHSGIDIKTEGVSGKKIIAVQDGYLSRISVSPGGFGKALYIKHPNGYTTVYGHLSNFTNEVERFVKEQQYQKKNFQINIFPKVNQFLFEKGQVVGYSGNTGSSLGPHLHFEVRDSKTEKPINPLLFHFDIEDTVQPVIYNIFLYPLTDNSFIDLKRERKSIKVVKKNGDLSLNTNDPIQVGGMIGIGIETNDFLNKARNKCGVYSIEILLDHVQVYLHELDQFSFSESRYINSHIDYEEKMNSKKNIHQTFIAANNKLSIYKLLKDRGRLSFYDNEIHEITIVIKDAYQNESRIEFSVSSRWEPDEIIEKPEQTYSKIMYPDINNVYKHNGIQLEIPSGALYDTLLFSYAKSPAIPGSYSEVHHIHNDHTPVHLNYTMRIKPDSVPEEVQGKLLVALVNDENEFISMGGDYAEEIVAVRCRSFGRFVVVADTIAPEIEPLSTVANMDLSGRRSLRFKITDDLSGIRSYNGFIDNQWVLFEYDAKNDRITYRFDQERLQNNRNHELVLTVIDNKENIAVFHANFYW